MNWKDSLPWRELGNWVSSTQLLSRREEENWNGLWMDSRWGEYKDEQNDTSALLLTWLDWKTEKSYGWRHRVLTIDIYDDAKPRYFSALVQIELGEGHCGKMEQLGGWILQQGKMLEKRSEKKTGVRLQRGRLNLFGFNWSLAGCNVRGPQTSLIPYSFNNEFSGLLRIMITTRKTWK